MLNQLAKRLANAGIRALGSLTNPFAHVATIELECAHPPVVPASPANTATLPLAFRQRFNEPVQRPRKLLYKLKGVSVSWHGLVMKNTSLLAQSLPFPEAYPEYSGTYLLRQWLGTPTLTSPAQLGLAHDFWSVNNYYHWLIDVLPRLLLLRQEYPAIVLMIPEPAAAYMVLSANALGFHNFFWVPKNSIVRKADVIMAGHVMEPGRQDRALLQKVRQLLLRNFALETNSTPGRRIFASRSTQRTRRLLNENELLILLKQYSFESVLFDDMQLAEQINLMQSVDIFIGIHGANMTNIMFLKKDAIVIELMDEQHPNLCYFNLAVNLGLSYYAIPCSGVPVPGIDHNNFDLNIEPVYLESILKQIVIS